MLQRTKTRPVPQPSKPVQQKARTMQEKPVHASAPARAMAAKKTNGRDEEWTDF
jgi:hypothetical protein